MKSSNEYRKYLLTGAVVLIAVAALLFKYWDYVANPWTRDGQVRADVIQIASRVTAPIVELPIEDNQFVRAGDVLFRLDPRTFEIALAQAQANLELTHDEFNAMSPKVTSAEGSVLAAEASVTQAEASVAEAAAQIDKNRADYEREQDLLPRNASSKKKVESARATYEVSKGKLKAAEAGLKAARAKLSQAQAGVVGARTNLGAPGEANPRLRLAEAQLRQVKLNLEFATIRAPVDGYVTNLNLRLGDQVVANRPVLALVDVNSYWVHGFFKETLIAHMEPGDRAVVTLMTYPDTPLEGRVESLGWGIAQADGAPGTDLLPSVAPTFEWIRLAQRIPVRIQLIDVPENIQLRVGSTCSVLVTTGEASAVPAAPAALR
jgi:multidrug resistance efflux pump